MPFEYKAGVPGPFGRNIAGAKTFFLQLTACNAHLAKSTEETVATYIGYYRPNQRFVEESNARAREGAVAMDPKFLQLVADLPIKLPSTAHIIGSFSPIGGATPGSPAVFIVEAADPSGLQFISNYYQGYLEFDWHPGVSIGANKNEREEWRQGVASQAQPETPIR